MLKRLANAIMTGRARRIYRRVGGYLPESGTIADVGSGTGHNAEWIRDRTGLTVREFDVTDLHWVGPGPEVSRPGRLPLDDDSVAGVLLLYVLQYCDDPVGLLRETSRAGRRLSAVRSPLVAIV